MIIKKCKLNNKGFTLVELIVVLVILAILAAILVPALLGYIDEAKKKQDVIDTKAIYTATQSSLSKIYATRSPFDSNKTNILKSGNSGTKACFTSAKYGWSYDIFNLVGYELTGIKPARFDTQNNTNGAGINGNDIWNTVGDKPYFVCVGLGDYNTYANPNSSEYDAKKAYTVYCVIYQATKDSFPIVYIGNDYVEENPFKDKKTFANACNDNTRGTYELESSGIKIQFYTIKQNTEVV